jgi:hypothetical protein
MDLLLIFFEFTHKYIFFQCHNLTFAVYIFTLARFYAGNFPYRAWHFGPFRGWRRRGRLRHHLAVESVAVPDFRGDFRIFNVL